MRLPRESTEFVPIAVTVNGAPAPGFSYALTGRGERPTTWTPATTLDGEAGFIATALTPGDHLVWVRVTDNPEAPVLLAGILHIT